MNVGWFVVGGLAWTASEYAIHRFVGHGPKRRRRTSLLARLSPAGLAAEFNAEHLQHHVTPTYFAPTSRKVAAAAAAVPMMATALAPILGARRAGSFALGFAVVYGTYEFLHRRIHTHPPVTAYGRGIRRNHLLHHHRGPRDNHGVTSPVFDRIFGTARPLERLRIPRAVAPVWMLDAETGAIRPEYAGDYEIWPAVARDASDGAPEAAERARAPVTATACTAPSPG